MWVVPFHVLGIRKGIGRRKHTEQGSTILCFLRGDCNRLLSSHCRASAPQSAESRELEAQTSPS